MNDSSNLTFSIVKPPLDSLEAKVLVLGVYSGSDGPTIHTGPLSGESAKSLNSTLEDLGVSGAVDQLYRLPGLEGFGADIIALIGLGKKKNRQVEALKALRYAAGSAIRQLAGTTSVTLALPADTVQELAAVSEGAALGSFVDTQLRSQQDRSVGGAVEDITFITPVEPEQANSILKRSLVLGRAVDSTRRLVNTPPNHLYPETFAERAASRVFELEDIHVTVLDEVQLKDQGFGGITGVGQGSIHPPRLAVVKYSPENARSSIALIGKGITFDSGGNSLKPAVSMMTMKSDMAGAATALNVVAASAELQLPVEVTAYLCIAENMPGGNALRPEDVITMRDGKTVEVLNTDAEGRLVMADGLAYASESHPDVIIDVATLTGAQMVALGTRVAAVMGDDAIRERVVDAASVSGEDFWPMPLPDYLREDLDSPVADLKNIGAGRWGGMLTAGLFLQEFVGETNGQKIPWAHLDIAGPSFNEGSPYGFTPKEGTGMSVATLLTLIESYCS